MIRPSEVRMRKRGAMEQEPFHNNPYNPNTFSRMEQAKEANKDIARYNMFSEVCMTFMAFTLFLAGIALSIRKIDGTGFISILITLGICFGAIAYNNHLVKSVLRKPNGTPEMRVISEAIKSGSEGYLSVQYTSIAIISSIFSVVLFGIYVWREYRQSNLSNCILKALFVSISFLSGCICSASAGYAGVWASVRVNSRVAEAARNENYEDSLLLSFRGGAISSILSSSLCIVGITFLYVVFSLFMFDVQNEESLKEHLRNAGLGENSKTVKQHDIEQIKNIVMLLGGYGFGASFVALFMQLGGGIYTKAADVGADMVGKIEQNIPEDDPRNPAVIADLVGDNVGDCAGSMADVFESIAGELIGTMILGASLVSKANLEGHASKFIFFSLIIHALNLVVSIAGIMAVSPDKKTEPLATMKVGFYVSVGSAIVGFLGVCYMMLHVAKTPGAWYHYLGCGVIGLLVSFCLVQITQYYTDYDYGPVKKIYEASATGHGTNVISGFSVGMESTGLPALVISIGLYGSYCLGKKSGIANGLLAGKELGGKLSEELGGKLSEELLEKFQDAEHVAGLFGTAVATMGMLCLSTFILSMNNFGPIADNAGGIVEMSEQPHTVREITDKLDAVGNVTKAATKGYAVGGSALACFLLFAAFMEEINEEITKHDNGSPIKVINVTKVEVMLAGLLGIAMIFLFVGFAVDAVGRTAAKVVLEVRRQFETYPGIMDRSQQPEYKYCVEIVTNSALHEMIKPAVLALITPITIGCIGRGLSTLQGKGQLGIEMLASFLIFGTLTGLLMAIFLDNAGGAWDNAKKLCEAKNQKGTLRHHAAVTGDTVGDPFKDTAGPALHVIITTMSTTALVLGPLFIYAGAGGKSGE